MLSCPTESAGARIAFLGCSYSRICCAGVTHQLASRCCLHQTGPSVALTQTGGYDYGLQQVCTLGSILQYIQSALQLALVKMAGAADMVQEKAPAGTSAATAGPACPGSGSNSSATIIKSNPRIFQLPKRPHCQAECASSRPTKQRRIASQSAPQLHAPHQETVPPLTQSSQAPPPQTAEGSGQPQLPDSQCPPQELSAACMGRLPTSSPTSIAHQSAAERSAAGPAVEAQHASQDSPQATPLACSRRGQAASAEQQPVAEQQPEPLATPSLQEGELRSAGKVRASQASSPVLAHALSLDSACNRGQWPALPQPVRRGCDVPLQPTYCQSLCFVCIPDACVFGRPQC